MNRENASMSDRGKKRFSVHFLFATTYPVLPGFVLPSKGDPENMHPMKKAVRISHPAEEGYKKLKVKLKCMGLIK